MRRERFRHRSGTASDPSPPGIGAPFPYEPVPGSACIRQLVRLHGRVRLRFHIRSPTLNGG